MPHYDFVCDECKVLLDDVVMSFEEFDEFKKAGKPCPDCGKEMRQPIFDFHFHFPTKVTDKGLLPTSRRGLMQMMEARYQKRNARLESMPEYYKRRMEKFFSWQGVRKSAPSSPDST